MVSPTIKNLTQLVDKNGKANPAETNPDFFINDVNIFAPVRYNSKVDFFTTGEGYYKRLGEVIDKATKSVFITGWQINHDIPLDKIDNPNGLTAKYRAQQAQAKKNAEQMDVHIKDTQARRKAQGNVGYEEYLMDLEASKKKYLQDYKAYDGWIENSKTSRTLWQCLRSAVERGVKVYVMPWMSPPFPSDIYTRCFETMLAIFQLNSGLSEQQAFCMPSIQLSDMGLGGVFFSHHQKSVIVDNEIAYVGGLDLAYGRRDNEMFRLKCDDRYGEDRYNNCIAAIDTARTDDAVTLIGLMLSTFTNIDTPARFINAYATVSNISTRMSNWWQTPSSLIGTTTPYLWLKEILGTSKKIRDDLVDDTMKQFLEIILLLIKLVHEELTVTTIQKQPVTTKPIKAPSSSAPANPCRGGDTISSMVQQASSTIKTTPITPPMAATTSQSTQAQQNTAAQQKLQTIWQKVGNNTATQADYVEALPLVLDWLQTNDYGHYVAIFVNLSINAIASKEQIEAATQTSIDIAKSLLWYFCTVFEKRAMAQPKPYYYLAEKAQPLFPKSGKTLNTDAQPRMPWHDVHVEVQGEAVYDLARNFIERWNTGQSFIETTKKPSNLPMVQTAIKWATCLYEENTHQTIKNMLSWTGAKINQFDIVQQTQQALDAGEPTPHYISGEFIPPKAQQIKGKEGSDAIVQILRSAAKNMVMTEQQAEQQAANYTHDNQVKMGNGPNQSYVKTIQNNCLQAWLKVIKGSQHFLYIENQFFQSVFGDEFGYYIDETKSSYSGPMTSLEWVDGKYSYYLDQINFKQALIHNDYKRIDWNKLAEIAVDTRNDNLIADLLNEILKTFKAQTTNAATNVLFTGQKSGLQNKIIDAIIQRIGRAIKEKRPYHVYIVIPVHPEGSLKSNTLMYQVHLTMQTIGFGTNSLIKMVQRALYIQKQIDLRQAKTDEEKQAIYDEVAAEERDPREKPKYLNEKGWSDYLTLLNLRAWEELNGMPATEQIYIHSKLLIADDSVAVIGSCNINDRSMLGGRDSELAAIIRGKQSKLITINGQDRYAVSEVVHNFRVNLWKKIFGLSMSSCHPRIQPAKSLQAVLNQPAAPATWQAIQEVAENNTKSYNESFQFIPQNISQVQVGDKAQKVPEGCEPDYPNKEKNYYPLRCSIWPTWVYEDPNSLTPAGELDSVMPFDPDFWLNPKLSNYSKLYRDEDPWYTKLLRTFSLKKYPIGIEGFIVALPYQWTMGENNASQINQIVVAGKTPGDGTGNAFAALTPKKDSTDA